LYAFHYLFQVDCPGLNAKPANSNPNADPNANADPIADPNTNTDPNADPNTDPIPVPTDTSGVRKKRDISIEDNERQFTTILTVVDPFVAGSEKGMSVFVGKVWL
jgi:hypothetical protein